MLRLTVLSNQYKKRTLRAIYAQTQAFPYAASLDPNFDRTSGQLSGSLAITGSKAAINPGSVASKLAGEVVTLTGSGSFTQTDKVRSFGLFANFVGGTMDELGDRAEVGVWKGVGGVFEILAPAFDDTGLSAAVAAEAATAATEVYMSSNTKGVLALNASSEGPEGSVASATPANAANRAVARVMDRLSANAVIVELLV